MDAVSPGDPIEGLRTICAEVGFDLDGVKPELLARLRLLAGFSHTVDDCGRMIATAQSSVNSTSRNV